MNQPLPILIALWSAAITFGLFAVGALVASAATSIRKGGRPSLEKAIGHLFGMAVIFGGPCAFVGAAALASSALLIAVEAPPITYLFLSLAGAASLDSAIRMRSGGMEGCNKAVGLVAAAYLTVWSGVSFWMLGGMATLPAELTGLRWLQPPLAALPFVVALRTLAKDKSSLRLLLAALIFVAALQAMLFFPLESGIAADWPPRSDWLRYPLAGIGVASIFILLRLVLVLGRKNPSVRKSRIRDLRRDARLWIAIGAACGLAWALARVLVAALRGAIA